MTDQNTQIARKKGDSRARAVSAIALVIGILLAVLVIIAAVVAVVFGVRFNNRIAVLEEQLAQANQVSAALEDYKIETNERFNAIEGSSGAGAPQFQVSNFTMDSEITEYDYIDDYITYEGQGFINETTNNGNNYLVVLKQTLVSGGVGYAEPVVYKFISVIDGSGEFSTYDYGTIFEVDEPSYDFEIIGYVTITD